MHPNFHGAQECTKLAHARNYIIDTTTDDTEQTYIAEVRTSYTITLKKHSEVTTRTKIDDPINSKKKRV